MEGKDESTKLWWPFNSIRVLVGTNNVVNREMVVAQLVERSLPIPEVRGSNPVKIIYILNICLLSTVY